MIILQAAQLVLYAGTMARCCELNLRDWGEPVQIPELARIVRHHSARCKQSDSGIATKTIGLRLSEKLHEELMIDQSVKTEHSSIIRSHRDFLAWGRT